MSEINFNTITTSRKRPAHNNVSKNETKKKELNAREVVKKRKKTLPYFRLKPNGANASLSIVPSERIPVTLTDVQYLLVHSLLGNLSLTEPSRWYVLDKCEGVKQTTCLVLEGISVHHWQSYLDEFKNTRGIFRNIVEMLTPSVYEGSLVQELALVPLSEAEKETIIHKYGSMNLALEAQKDLMIMMKALFPIGNQINEVSYSNEDKFPRTQLLLSVWQLIDEKYPVPLKGKLGDGYADYVLTKHEYAPVTPASPLFGLDCEMCLTNEGSELTRVSVVNEKHEVIYESLVKPYNDITNYLTQYSGITKSLLKNVTIRLQDVQKELQALLPPDAILVGQSLNVDLNALKMMHPYVIDTSVSYNLAGERTRKPKLKTLAQQFLKESIQMGKAGHCSTEDSLAALKLVQLKLSKSIEFGNAVHTKREKFKENFTKMMNKPQHALSIFNHTTEKKKSSLIIGCDDITGDYRSYLIQAQESMSSQLNKRKPKKIKLVTVDSVEEVITSFTDSVSDYNLAMAHLKLVMGDEQQSGRIKNIDKWIKKIWNRLVPSSFFVVIFGGTTDGNGLALIKVKES